MPDDSFLDTLIKDNPELLQSIIWVFPLNEHYHWQLLVVVHPSTPNRKLMLFDSLPHFKTGISSNLATVKMFAKQLINTAMYWHSPPETPPAYLAPASWVTNIQAPRQPNGYDCGIFTILFATHALGHLNELINSREGQSFHHWFTVEHAVNLRSTMCSELRNDVLSSARQNEANAIILD
jgi:Ulp1 family protease